MSGFKPGSTLAPGLIQQIDMARAEVRRLKEVVPQIFPDYQRLHSAKLRLTQAQVEFDTAHQQWERLGQS